MQLHSYMNQFLIFAINVVNVYPSQRNESSCIGTVGCTDTGKHDINGVIKSSKEAIIDS